MEEQANIRPIKHCVVWWGVTDVCMHVSADTMDWGAMTSRARTLRMCMRGRPVFSTVPHITRMSTCCTARSTHLHAIGVQSEHELLPRLAHGLHPVSAAAAPI